MSIKKYNRYWAVYDESEELICLCVYKKGAQEVVRRMTNERRLINNVQRAERNICR